MGKGEKATFSSRNGVSIRDSEGNGGNMAEGKEGEKIDRFSGPIEFRWQISSRTVQDQTSSRYISKPDLLELGSFVRDSANST